MSASGRDAARPFGGLSAVVLAVFALLLSSLVLITTARAEGDDTSGGSSSGGSNGAGQASDGSSGSSKSGAASGASSESGKGRSSGSDKGNGNGSGSSSDSGKTDGDGSGGSDSKTSSDAGTGSGSGQTGAEAVPQGPTKADILALEAAQKALAKAKVRYAAALVAHKNSMKQVKKMRKEAAAAQAVATDARRDLGNMARLAYTSGNGSLNVLAGIISADSPQDLMERAAAAERLSEHQDAEFDAADATRTEAERLTREAVRFFKAAEDELASAKQDLKETKALAGSLSLENKFNITGKPVDLNTKSEWIFPVPGFEIGSEAGMRLHPILGYTRCHAGADISAPSGTAIHAVDDGIVVSASGDSGGYGNYTVISHGRGLTSAFAHQSAMVVEAGDEVKRGQIIGTVGSTGLSSGPHLHFEARYFGDPYNPRGWLQNIPELRVPSC